MGLGIDQCMFSLGIIATYACAASMIPGTDQVVSRKTCPPPIDIIQDIVALNDESGSASRFGSFSGGVYDTAWLSMVSKFDLGLRSPLFPDCFNYLLASQQDDGAWGATASQVDGITNSLAGLLALATRRRSKRPDSLESSSLSWRIERSRSAIQCLLQDWNVSQSVQVGFEILVPSLLRQLKSFDIHFDFPGHSTLMQLHNQKLRKFDPTLVYSTKSTTLLHSLEAFVGLVDFDRVGHHCSEASGIFASPAATAAYLINAAAWDYRAERYLKMVVTASGKTGAVPSAYPTCLFELSWALSTLLPILLPSQPTETEQESLGQVFKKPLYHQDGVCGFAPGILEDADDTARALMVLQCLGKPMSPDRMIERFQTDKYFRTYRLEGSPSFSANCHVLIALLGYSDIGEYQDHIEKALTFLLEAEESDPIVDKWNLSPQYCRMLFMQALLSVLDKHNSGCLESIPATMIYERIPGSICRLLGQTLSTQENNGSWAESLEITAYSILTIAHCLSFPWTTDLKGQMVDSILQGRQYLHNEYGATDKVDYLWVEKVSYRSSLLHSTYCSAALNIDIKKYNWSSAIIDCFSLSDVRKPMGYLISTIPLFQKSKLASVDLVLIEAGQISKRLRKFRDVLFSRDDIPMTADKYVDFIPMIWVACVHRSGHILSASVVWEMVLLSLLNFQVDEYMESVVARIADSELPMLAKLLKRACVGTSGPSITAVDATTYDWNLISPEGSQEMNWDEAKNVQNDLPEHSALTQAVKALSQFTQHVTQHWSVLQSPKSMQQELARETHNFLVAHIIHNQDNALLTKSKSTRAKDGLQHVTNERTYLKWVRSTASDDTSCPFSFLFFASLISGRGRNCFEGVRASYLSKSLCGHLATMCRQYNDFGSAKRDAEECNLNSLDFPEFQNITSHMDGFCTADPSVPANASDAPSARLADTNGALEAIGEKDDLSSSENKVKDSVRPSAKDNLMAIADFERSCMQLAMKNLTQIVPPTTIRKLQVFIDVTEMFGQIYVQKDIASRVKNSAQ